MPDLHFGKEVMKECMYANHDANAIETMEKKEPNKIDAQGESQEREEFFQCLKEWCYHDFEFEKIGEGFFGTVFKVIHKKTGQILVLKELKSASDNDHKAMFMDEINTLARLCHPNILRCEGFALHGSNFCLLTEYIDGGSLDDLLVRRDTMLSSWEMRLSVAMEIAFGMVYLHSAGIIHRDLTSKNILIRKRSNGKIQAIVADLGLSHTVPLQAFSEEEYNLDTVGSPFHMAPEVLNHKPYNMKADVFSYGIILCEMITMCPGADPDDVPRTNDFGLAVDDFSEMAVDCPSKLLDLTVRCCQVNPKERPSFIHIVKALDIILDKMIESSDDAFYDNDPLDTNLDCVIEKSLICTCSDDNECDVSEGLLGIKDSRNRFGSIEKTASRRLLKRHLPRCQACGGRVWKRLGTSENQDPYTAPTDANDVSSLNRRDFTAVSLLNESHGTFATRLNLLAENTPGKLPRFFQNILRSKLARFPKDVKRRWRKSLHDIFNSQNNAQSKKEEKERAESIISSNPSDGETLYKSNDESTDAYKNQWQNKPERRKKSASRKTSGEKTSTYTEKQANNGSDNDVNATPQSTKLKTSTESNSVTFSQCTSVNAVGSSLSKTLAVSVDSLDKLNLADGPKDLKDRRRRYSMPSRRLLHKRSQSNDPSKPSLRKQSSGSSKIFNFLRRKAQSTPSE